MHSAHNHSLVICVILKTITKQKIYRSHSVIGLEVIVRKQFENLCKSYIFRGTCVICKCLWEMCSCRDTLSHGPSILPSDLESSPFAWTIGYKFNLKTKRNLVIVPLYLTFREFLQVQIDSMLGSEDNVAGEGRRPGEVWSYLKAEQNQGNGHL